MVSLFFVGLAVAVVFFVAGVFVISMPISPRIATKEDFVSTRVSRCKSCDNPYSSINLYSKISRYIPGFVRQQPPKKQPPKTQPPRKQLEKIPPTMSICLAMDRAGFDPKWTYSDVHKMSKTVDGLNTINNISQYVKRYTWNKNAITLKQVQNCYPNYVKCR